MSAHKAENKHTPDNPEEIVGVDSKRSKSNTIWDDWMMQAHNKLSSTRIATYINNYYNVF